MKNCAKPFNQFSILFIFFLAFSNSPTFGADGIDLYTPYTKLAVSPGESVEYTVDVKNSSNSALSADVYLTGLPKGWDYSLKAGGYSIQQISVLPGEKKSLTLKVQVPLNAVKGNQQFRVVARNYAILPLVIDVSEQGSFKTVYTSDQINLQGNAKSNFNFTTKLKNETGESQVYSLQASPPRGWNVIFKPNSKQATAVEIAPNSTTNVIVEVTPPYNVEAGSYKIPVAAANRSTSASLELEVVITGNYEIQLTTPTGLMSARLTAGNNKRVELSVVNTGSGELNDIVFRSSQPRNWEVSFEPDTIPRLKAGEKTQVFANIKAYEKAIPGDYVASITAQTSEVSSKADFRIAVHTPMLWGWMGILIVLVIIGLIFYLFRKYGRR